MTAPSFAGFAEGGDSPYVGASHSRPRLAIFGSGFRLCWLRRHERFSDVVQIRGGSFDALEDGIALAIVVIDVGTRNKIVQLNDQPDRLRLAFRVANRGS